MQGTKQLSIFLTLFALAAAAVASVSTRLPKGTATGEEGPGGCPVYMAEVKIQEVNPVASELAVTESGQKDNANKNVLKVDDQTKFRIPGVDAKEAGLEKVPTGRLAKIQYCGTDGRLIEIKVLRDKS